ncbi:MAG: thiamine biosynthesis protein ThiS [Ignavibacteria bacterium RBG_13_36_8]|nr:MAG: thiamine biosynthesis protein ThiS [Ignavibacteria bacterium RBG_13_36_8]
MIIINDRDKVEWKEGMTVRDLLDKMNYTYSLITVVVDDEVVLEEDYDHFKLKDETNVSVFHLAHGG